MNDNAFSQERIIVINETYAGKLSRSTGFKRSGGYIMPLEERIKMLKVNGQKVEKTKQKVIVI